MNTTSPKIRTLAKNFLKEYRINQLTNERLKEIIVSQGYTIIKYSKIYNDENVEIILNTLNLIEYVKYRSAFTYQDSSNRFVFIEDNLSEKEELILLAHEEGHIYCNHMDERTTMGKDIADEYDANEFSHYILNPNIKNKTTTYILSHKKNTILVATLVLLIIASSIIIPIKMNSDKYYGEYYVSTSGQKYHKKSCYYIKDKTHLRRVTKEDIKNHVYEP